MDDDPPIETSQCTGETNTGLPSSISGYHLLKWVPLKDTFVPIITQNENGPCPLLALCNVLLLQNMMELPKGETIVTTQRLLELLGSCLLHCRPNNLSHTDQFNYEQNMGDAISIFPRLLTGLDVNVNFNSVDGFEFTQELSIFDLLGVNLYHGWLADPNDTVTYPVVSRFSYNQLVEYTINNMTSSDTHLQEEALVSQEFLNNTATQLTYHGLYELNQRVSDGEFCVFFRNNHFNTLLKREDKLMLLVTDFGFLNEFGHVWHLLTDIDDSGDFLDADFRFISQVDTPVTSPTANTAGQTRTQPSSSSSPSPRKEDAATIKENERLDYNVAANLQAEEDQKINQTSFESDQDLALRLQEQEMLEQDVISQPNPAPRDDHYLLPPPTTRDEYEAAAQLDRNKSSSISCLIM